MLKQKFNCPAELTVSLFSGKWRVIVLWLLRRGPQRSGKLKSKLPGITAAAFSNAVRELEQDGLIFRRMRPVLPLEVSYGLTAKGESLRPLVKMMVKWGLEHQSDYVSGKFGMADFGVNSALKGVAPKL
jgi:DNA-binding HxlR family transcriptional regulator